MNPLDLIDQKIAEFEAKARMLREIRSDLERTAVVHVRVLSPTPEPTDITGTGSCPSPLGYTSPVKRRGPNTPKDVIRNRIMAIMEALAAKPRLVMSDLVAQSQSEAYAVGRLIRLHNNWFVIEGHKSTTRYLLSEAGLAEYERRKTGDPEPSDGISPKMAGMRALVARYLMENENGKQLIEIARQTGVVAHNLETVLRMDWFDKQGALYTITDAGRAAIMGK